MIVGVGMLFVLLAALFTPLGIVLSQMFGSMPNGGFIAFSVFLFSVCNFGVYRRSIASLITMVVLYLAVVFLTKEAFIPVFLLIAIYFIPHVGVIREATKT